MLGQPTEGMHLLKSGVLQAHDIQTVGIAAHTQGADNIKPELLHQAFLKKLEWGKSEMDKGNFQEIYWCTQMSFSTHVIIEWEKEARSHDRNGALKNKFNMTLHQQFMSYQEY